MKRRVYGKPFRYSIDESGFVQSMEPLSSTSVWQSTRMDDKKVSQKAVGSVLEISKENKKSSSLFERKSRKTKSPGIPQRHKNLVSSFDLNIRKMKALKLLQTQNNAHQVLKPIVQCPNCNVDFRKSYLGKHQQDYHPEPPEVPNKAIGKPKKPKYVGEIITIGCPTCGTTILKNNLDEHLASHRQKRSPKVTKRSVGRAGGMKVKNNKIDQHNQQKNTKSRKGLNLSSAGRLMEKCEICSVNVRVDRIKKHYKKVHGPNHSENLLGKKKINNHDYDHRKDNAKYKNEAYRQSSLEPRDGSKDWGFMSRENGQFGSHPIFDDYGEDSIP